MILVTRKYFMVIILVTLQVVKSPGMPITNLHLKMTQCLQSSTIRTPKKDKKK